MLAVRSLARPARRVKASLGGAAGAADEASRQRKRGELVSGASGQEPGLELGDELGELFALGRLQGAGTTVSGPQELQQPPTLGRTQMPEMLSRQQSDLGDREQLEER
jgi:hypothetical protein